MNDQFLIPANSKKSELILGLFTRFDLVLLLVGLGLTALLVVMFQGELNSLGSIIGVLLPAFIAIFLVFPIPNYHNVLQLIINMYTFFFVRQRTYKWRGWCFRNERK